jgi:hypothetical protein
LNLFHKILVLTAASLCTQLSSAQSTIIPDLQVELKDEIRIPDTWELIIETRIEDDSKMLSKMTSYRENGHEKLQLLNLKHCTCSEIWLEYADKFELPITSTFIPLVWGQTNSEDCQASLPLFEKLSKFSGKSSELIDYLEMIWGDRDGFEEMLYDLKITIRLIENLDIPNPCKRTHKVKNGETLYRISVIYGVSVEALQDANGLGTSTNINSGSFLSIP